MPQKLPGVLKKPVVMILKQINMFFSGWLAFRQERAGRDNRQREFGLWKKKGELRTPLQASQQVWTVLQLVPGCDQPT